MSSNETVFNNGQQSITNYDIAKIFLWNKRTSRANYTNSSYVDVVLVPGTLMGRISATQEIIPLVHTAVDGSQYPVGILMSDITVDDGDTVELTMCDQGDVAEDKIVLHAGDTLSSVVSGRSLRDHLITLGVRPVVTREHTANDNQ